MCSVIGAGGLADAARNARVEYRSRRAWIWMARRLDIRLYRGILRKGPSMAAATQLGRYRRATTDSELKSRGILNRGEYEEVSQSRSGGIVRQLGRHRGGQW